MWHSLGCRESSAPLCPFLPSFLHYGRVLWRLHDRSFQRFHSFIRSFVWFQLFKSWSYHQGIEICPVSERLTWRFTDQNDIVSPSSLFPSSGRNGVFRGPDECDDDWPVPGVASCSGTDASPRESMSQCRNWFIGFVLRVRSELFDVLLGKRRP